MVYTYCIDFLSAVRVLLPPMLRVGHGCLPSKGADCRGRHQRSHPHPVPSGEFTSVGADCRFETAEGEPTIDERRLRKRYGFDVAVEDASCLAMMRWDGLFKYGMAEMLRGCVLL